MRTWSRSWYRIQISFQKLVEVCTLSYWQFILLPDNEKKCNNLCFHFWINDTKGHLNDNDWCHFWFFESAIRKIAWSQLRLKFVLNNFEAHWQQHTGRHLTVEDWSTHVLILSWVKIMRRKLTKVAGKLSVGQKSQPARPRALHQNRRWYFTYFCILPFLSNEPSFLI